jgi:hypothetical protein
VSGPATAREALIAEALGELVRVVDRVEALGPALDQARRDLVQQLDHIERRMTLVTDQAKVRAAEHLARCTQDAAAQAVRLQARAMSDAARTVFQHELRSTLATIARRDASAPSRRWLQGLGYVATALASSALTVLALAWWVMD